MHFLCAHDLCNMAISHSSASSQAQNVRWFEDHFWNFHSYTEYTRSEGAAVLVDGSGAGDCRLFQTHFGSCPEKRQFPNRNSFFFASQGTSEVFFRRPRLSTPPDTVTRRLQVRIYLRGWRTGGFSLWPQGTTRQRILRNGVAMTWGTYVSGSHNGAWWAPSGLEERGRSIPKGWGTDPES